MTSSLGKYYGINSPIHQLDPRTKVIITFFLLISLFFVDTLYQFALVAIFLSIIIGMAKIPVKVILRGLRPVFFLFVATIIFQSVTNGGEVLYSFWIFKVTDQGVDRAFHMGFRLLLLVSGGSMLSYTTTVLEITKGLDKMLSPLEKIKISVHDITFMSTIAIKFIPVLIVETEKIKEAQISRGADFGGKNVIKQGKSLINVLIPVFVATFQRVNELAQAMDSRCFQGGSERTAMHRLKFYKRDYISYGVMIFYLGMLIALRFI